MHLDSATIASPRRFRPAKSARLQRALLLSGAVALAAQPALSNPPPPQAFPLPDVHVLRVTTADLGGLRGGSSVRMMFEILNWTDQDVYGIALAINTAEDSDPPPMPARFLSASVEPEGRPFGLAVDDDANFPGGAEDDGTGDATKLGATNTFTVDSQTSTRVIFTGATPIPPRDLIGAGTPEAACALVVSCTYDSMTETFTIDPESIDNSLDDMKSGDVDNVLDGFIVTFENLILDQLVSINFFLLDDQGEPIGYSSGGTLQGNGFGSGVINVFQIFKGLRGTRSHGDPVWTREQGLRGVPPTGNTGTEDPPANLRDMFDGVSVFDNPNTFIQVEIGAALVGDFENPDDSLIGTTDTESNGEILDGFTPVELMSFSIEQ